MGSTEFLWAVTHRAHTVEQGQEIDRRVKAIDRTAGWNGPVRIPGNTITGWLVRPNDGTNDHLDVRQRNKLLSEIVAEVLEGE